LSRDTERRAVGLTVDLHYPLLHVWRALIDKNLLARWLMPTDFMAEVGRPFTFKSPPTPLWDGIVRGTVLEAVEKKRLKLTWVGGGLDTVVTWTLAPARVGTRLVLEQDGFTSEQGAASDSALGGWRQRIDERLPMVLEALV
jgi:uncharacterized protein YndB with AHSA1/START domain